MGARHRRAAAASDPDGDGTAAATTSCCARSAADLPKVLGARALRARRRRPGAGAGGETRVLVALQESFVDLDPVARAQPLGGNVLVRGRLHEGFQRPEAFVTAPDGTVLSRVLIGGDPVRFGGTFRCGPQKGRYQIEVTGEDRFGATVVANFPVWCGVAAPTTAAAASPAGAGKRRSASPTTPSAEQTSLEAAQRRSRARRAAAAGVGRAARRGRARPLGRHAGAQASSGTSRRRPARPPIARARRNVDAMLILENVARAFYAGRSGARAHELAGPSRQHPEPRGDARRRRRRLRSGGRARSW